MRTHWFVFALLWGLISVCAASDQPKPAPKSAAVSSDSEPSDARWGIIHTEVSQPDSDFQLDPNHRYVQREQPRTVTCLKMRTYLMARESRDSDATEWVGYATCLPSSKYDVKRADGQPGVVLR